MARTLAQTATGTGALLALLCGNAIGGDQPAIAGTVALHVAYYQNVQPEELAAATQLAT